VVPSAKEAGYGLLGAIFGCVLGPVLGFLGLWLSSFITGTDRIGEGDIIFLFLFCFVGGAWIGGIIGLRLARGFWPWI